MTTAAPIPEVSAVTVAIETARKSQEKAWDTLLEQDSWTVYTDGSAPIKNPGGAIGFSAVYVLDKNQAWECYGGTPGRTSDPATSNNRAEIAGVLSIIEVLYLLKQEDRKLPSDLRVVCDSQYVVNCAQGKWKKHKNKDLWKRFDQLMCVARQQGVKVKFEWTRAHVGTKWNERADVLAKDGAFLAIGKKPSSAPVDDAEVTQVSEDSEPGTQAHYTLRLYSEMTGKVGAKGVYRLSTPKREREAVIEWDDVLTLDEAEYLLLIRGFDDLISTLGKADRDTAEFRLQVDSSRDLMLKQIQGLYGVKSERLQPLHKKALQAARRFEGVQWQKSQKAELKSELKCW